MWPCTESAIPFGCILFLLTGSLLAFDFGPRAALPVPRLEVFCLAAFADRPLCTFLLRDTVEAAGAGASASSSDEIGDPHTPRAAATLNVAIICESLENWRAFLDLREFQRIIERCMFHSLKCS